MNSLQSLFTGYLLQAIALYGKVGGTKVIKELDRFNPDREPHYGDFIRSVASNESYKSRFATPKGSLSLESLDSNKNVYSKEYRLALEADATSVSARIDDKDEENLHRSANLSVGKVFNVDFTTGSGLKVTVPITVRLISMIVPSTRMTHILTADALKMTDLKERFYAWRAGRLSLIGDLLFSKDLIRQHRKEMMNDKDGIYSNILRKRVTNNVSTFVNASPSLAAASNMIVMSSDTAKEIESKLNGKFSNFQIRNRFFGDDLRGKVMTGTSLMIMVIVDKFADRITVYSEGISEASTFSLREIKSAGKSSGPDVTEILKAYQLGSQPSTL